MYVSNIVWDQPGKGRVSSPPPFWRTPKRLGRGNSEVYKIDFLKRMTQSLVKGRGAKSPVKTKHDQWSWNADWLMILRGRGDGMENYVEGHGWLKGMVNRSSTMFCCKSWLYLIVISLGVEYGGELRLDSDWANEETTSNRSPCS